MPTTFVCPSCQATVIDDCPNCPPRIEVSEGGASSIIALKGEMAIGRGEDASIRLKGSWIALRHATLSAAGGAHQLNAENLVSLGGREIKSALLHDGDTLRLFDEARSSFTTLRYLNHRAPKIAAVQHFATPPGVERLSIGRVGADINLSQPLVSKKHAELLWQDNRHVLRDTASRTGTYVNGVKITEDTILKPQDIVQIGTFRLTYDGDSLDSFDERSVIRLDVRGVTRATPKKLILHETSLSIEPCEFIGIVGASGSGKSTLMTSLCGFQPPSTGEVLINGGDLYQALDAYRAIVGYVPQDDILHRSLSVKDALQYTAELRLPNDTTKEELQRRINDVLKEVEMSAHQETMIDALSGGQRKRVSIASEMLADPPLLFLDEPTSGLDPGLERKMMYTLRSVADGGRTVVLVTHATANITQCDHIIFMAEGRMIWFGPPRQALSFFEVEDFADIYTKTDGNAALWEEKFKASLQHQKYVIERAARAPEKKARSTQQSATAQTPRKQLSILSHRYLRLIRNDQRNLLLLLLQAPIIGLLLLLVSRGGSLTSEGRIEAKKLLFMLATTGVWFGVINAAREICKEAAIYRREKLAGLTSWSYLGSKIAVLSVMVLVQNALLFAILSLKMSFPQSDVLLPGWLSLYVTMSLAGLAGVSMGLFISVIAMTPDKATSLIPILLVPQLLFAGMIFKLRGATGILSWLTTSRWAIDAMGVATRLNELRDLIPLGPEPRFDANATNLLSAWGCLSLQTILLLLVSWAILRRRA